MAATPPTPLANDITLFARTNYRNLLRPFGIKTDDRRRHMYLIGKTGMGKSTMLENMIIQDIRAGRGLAVVDPHGDLVEKIINFVPSYRVNDVVYFNPADMDYPMAFNPLESVDPAHRHLIASGLISVFKKIWVDSWGPRLEYILRNTILALIESPGSTLLGVTRLLVDKEYRRKVMNHISDPIVKAFWRDEFSAFSNQFRTEAISPIQNKIGQFLSSSIIRNIVGQPKSTIDMRSIMDSGKILLMNLAKGRIGEDNAALLGAMMITKLQLSAMSRIDIPEVERKDFFLYVDEFQNFATESFANILSEARKYRLDLIIAHQYIEQLDEKVRAAVFGNVGTIITFRVGAADAEFLAKEYTPVFEEPDLLNLTKYDIYLKLMIDGVASEPFSATGLPPVQNPDNLEPSIIRVSRERYANPREAIEEKISRWSGFTAAMAGAAEVPSQGERLPDRPAGPPARSPDPRPISPRPAEGPRPISSTASEMGPLEEPGVQLERQPVVAQNIPEPISLTQALQIQPNRSRPSERSRGEGDRLPGGQPRPRWQPRPAFSGERQDRRRPDRPAEPPRSNPRPQNYDNRRPAPPRQPQPSINVPPSVQPTNQPISTQNQEQKTVPLQPGQTVRLP